MKRNGDVLLKVLLAESFGCRFTLELPVGSVGDEDTPSMQIPRDISFELPPNVIFVIGLLNMLQVYRMVDDVHPAEGNGHLVGGAILLVEFVPCFDRGLALYVDCL